MKHTKEPWRHGTTLNHERHQIFDDGIRPGEPGCFAETFGSQARENAARICACVNAMRDVRDPTQFMADARAIASGTKKPASEMAEILNRFQMALLK